MIKTTAKGADSCKMTARPRSVRTDHFPCPGTLFLFFQKKVKNAKTFYKNSAHETENAKIFYTEKNYPQIPTGRNTIDRHPKRTSAHVAKSRKNTFGHHNVPTELPSQHHPTNATTKGNAASQSQPNHVHFHQNRTGVRTFSWEIIKNTRPYPA